MTDTELSKITHIPLSTLNGYKKSNNDKTLLYYVLKSIPNLATIYDKVIDEYGLMVTSYPELEERLYDKLSTMPEYSNYTFDKRVHVSYETKKDNEDTTVSIEYDFCATENENKIIIFEVRPVLLYGKKLEAMIKPLYESAKDKYRSVEICFLTLNPKERNIDTVCDVTMKSIGELLSIPDDKLIIV